MRRICEINRSTKETEIYTFLNLDAKNNSNQEIKQNINLNNNFFKHLLQTLFLHGNFEYDIQAKGDLQHHIVEDLGICLGKAFKKAIDKKKGIKRYGQRYIPMDETLVLTVIDISGRSYFNFNVDFTREKINGFTLNLIKEFWKSFADHAYINLHINKIKGGNNHHVAEAIFKATGMAFNEATTIIGDEFVSTKKHKD